MRRRFRGMLWVVCLPVMLGCATFVPPAIDPADCGRVELEPSPLWTASTIWSADGSRLMLIDPRSRSLLAYSWDGQLAERHELDPLSSLDYETPIRLQSVASGYVIGDRARLVYLDPELELIRVETLSDQARDVSEGQLSDFVLSRDRLLAYADLLTGEDEWQRGFVSFSGPTEPVRWFLDLPIEPDGEFNHYYHYDKRPYIVDDHGKSYLLRFTEPPSVYRIEGRKLRKIFSVDVDGDPEGEAVALHAWQGSLYLLVRGPAEDAADADHEAPELEEGNDLPRAHLDALMVLKSGYRWWLVRIDPSSGRMANRYELPSTAPRLQLVPGEPSWGLIEESLAPNMDEEKGKTTLLLLPSAWLDGRGRPPEVALTCGG